MLYDLNEKNITLSMFDGADDNEKFAAAMEYMRNVPGTTLTVEPGVYHFSTGLARETQRAVMNGEYGSNPQKKMFSSDFEYSTVISFDGHKNTKMLAYGAVFEIDGFMQPVSIVNCENVEAAGFTITHKRKPYSRGIITVENNKPDENEDIVCRLTLADDCPITEKTPVGLRNLFFDPSLQKELTLGLSSFEFIDNHHARLKIKADERLHDGIEMYIIHTYHSRPAILIEYAENIKLTDVTVHNQPGMGVVGNRCRDVFLRGLRVIPVGTDRVSTNTDATHFVATRGKLRYENCIFDAHGDDFCNVHGYYHEVIKCIGKYEAELREKTPDGTHTASLDYFDIGDVIEMTDKKTLKLIDTYTVISCELHPETRSCRVVFDHALPEDTDGLVFADITGLPELEIIGCTASKHFARSILIKCRKALIEDNTFVDVQGPAVVAAAEAWWYEGVTPANIIVRKNRIINCALRFGEAAGIVVKSDCECPTERNIYNIVIEDNIIDAPGAQHAVFLRNVNGGRVTGNKFNVGGQPVATECCCDVTVEKNSIM